MNISGANPNISDTDLSHKAIKKELKINQISEVKGNLSNAIEKAKTNETDEIFFKSDGKNYVASGKQIDINSFENDLKTSKQMKFNGKEISIDFVDNHKMELNSAAGLSTFNIKEIRELNVGSINDAITKTKGKKLDEVFFSVAGKDYVAYGKKMDIDSIQNAVNSNQLTFNGQEVCLKSVVDVKSNLKEKLLNDLGRGIGSVICDNSTVGTFFLAGGVAGFCAGGPVGAAVGAAIGFVTGVTVAFTAGFIEEGNNNGTFNKPDYQSIEYVGPKINFNK